MTRAFVFIDGSNFYFRLKELSGQVDGKYSLLDFHYVGTAKGQSFGLTKVSDDVRLLRPEDIKQFLSSSLI